MRDWVYMGTSNIKENANLKNGHATAQTIQLRIGYSVSTARLYAVWMALQVYVGQLGRKGVSLNVLDQVITRSGERLVCQFESDGATGASRVSRMQISLQKKPDKTGGHNGKGRIMKRWPTKQLRDKF